MGKQINNSKKIQKKYDEKYNNDSMKIRKIKNVKNTFIIMTFISIAIAFVFYISNIGADFLVQMFMGISTGCLVCALQEIIKIEELKIDIANKEDIKKEIESESKNSKEEEQNGKS